MNSKYKPIGIISHDAGGAQLLSHFIINQKKEFLFYCEGNSKKIFQNNIKSIVFSKLKDLFSRCDLIYITTGSEFEKKHIDISLSLKKEVIVFLDHWINYRKRLLYKNKFLKPKKIIVFDNYAYSLSKKVFPKTEIQKKKNYFLAYLKKGIEKNTEKKYLLILSEPIKEFRNDKSLKYDEYSSLENFLNFLKNKNTNYDIIIKLHPLERKNKYNNLIRKYKNINIRIYKEFNLLKLMTESKYIFGFNSSLLFYAKKMKIKTYRLMKQNSKLPLRFKHFMHSKL